MMGGGGGGNRLQVASCLNCCEAMGIKKWTTVDLRSAPRVNAGEFLDPRQSYRLEIHFCGFRQAMGCD